MRATPAERQIHTTPCRRPRLDVTETRPSRKPLEADLDAAQAPIRAEPEHDFVDVRPAGLTGQGAAQGLQELRRLELPFLQPRATAGLELLEGRSAREFRPEPLEVGAERGHAIGV